MGCMWFPCGFVAPSSFSCCVGEGPGGRATTKWGPRISLCHHPHSASCSHSLSIGAATPSPSLGLREPGCRDWAGPLCPPSPADS